LSIITKIKIIADFWYTLFMKRFLQKCRISAAGILLLFFIALSASAQESLIKIGVSLGLTGKYSEMSDMQMKGFRLWESDVNKRGGLLGKKVRVIIYDDKSDPGRQNPFTNILYSMIRWTWFSARTQAR